MGSCWSWSGPSGQHEQHSARAAGADTLPWAAQTYYKLSYVDRRIDNPEQRICEDIPKLADGLGDLLGEWCKCAP